MKNRTIIFRVFFVITLCTIAGLGVKAVEINKIVHNLDAQIYDSRQELIVDQQRLEELRQEKEDMNSLEYIEKVAREKLGMVKKDDIIFKERK